LTIESGGKVDVFKIGGGLICSKAYLTTRFKGIGRPDLWGCGMVDKNLNVWSLECDSDVVPLIGG
jgi:hypothetical protein